MSKRLYIDMYQCDECDECTVKCDYLYQPEITDHGIRDLREQVSYMLVCRRCEEPSCITACKFEALEREANGILKRHNMRCVSCKCCSQACPFGTIYPELTPFYIVRCDYCLQKLTTDEPGCVTTCVKNAISFRDVEENEADGVYIVNEHFAVHAPKWSKKEL
jgi:Fe-S-cluster-containing dehydrogenase component